jgi:hypothetical protein
MLNQHLSVPHFKMETVQEIRSQLRVGDWAIKLDMKDAYFHIPVRSQDQKYLRFAIGGKAYQFVAMCFGLSPAPLIFTKVFRSMAAYLRLLGFLIHLFLDDWLLRARSPEELLERAQFVLDLARRLGVIINLKKSDLTPRQIFEYLGLVFNLVLGLVFPSQESLRKVRGWSLRLHSVQEIPARLFLSLLGLLNHLCQVVTLGRLHLRALQWYLKCFWTPHRDPLDVMIPLLPTFFEAFQWWELESNLDRGALLHPPDPQISVVSDASLRGWGGHCLSHTAQGLWSAEETSRHINELEMLSVIRCLEQFGFLVQDKVVLVQSDNTTVVSYIKREGGTHSWGLYLLTRRLFSWCQQHRVTLRVAFIPGRLNAWADMLSRSSQILRSEWSLLPAVFKMLLRFCPSMQVDLFATCLNAKMSAYVSPGPDDSAWASDALSISWEGLVAYAFPPSILIHQVLRKIQSQSCMIVLVAPLWPAQSWFPTLLSLLVDVPLEVPKFKRLLKQPHQQVFHTGLDTLNLHVWPLSSNPSLRADFQQRLQSGQPPISVNPLFHYTNLTSRRFLVGYLEGISLWSRSLCL